MQAFLGEIYKKVYFLASMLPVKYLNPFLPKEILLDTVILLLSIFFNWNWLFMLVKLLFFDFNIIKFYNFFHSYTCFKNLCIYWIYNFPLFSEYNKDLPSALSSPTQKQSTQKNFFVFQKMELSELKKWKKYTFKMFLIL